MPPNDHDTLIRIESMVCDLHKVMFGSDQTPEKGLLNRFNAVEQEHLGRKADRFPTCTPAAERALSSARRNGWHIAGLWTLAGVYGFLMYELFSKVYELAREVKALQ
jgi:hypothetical protein